VKKLPAAYLSAQAIIVIFITVIIIIIITVK